MTATFDPTLPCIEILPSSKTHARQSIEFLKSHTEAGGRLVINQGRKSSEYLMAEFPAHGGRGFRFQKVAGATDTTATSEDVFIPDTAGHRSCSCRGFQRFGDCKHVEAVVAILENGWLDIDAPAIDPDDDLPECFRGVGTTSEGCPF